MQIVAVLEIVPDSSGALPTALLSAAYRASRSGYVMLALRGTSPRAVDRVLDPLVSSNRSWRLSGVIYVDATDERSVCGVAQRARVVMASSHELRSALMERGIFVEDADRAVDRLGELERGIQSAAPRGVTLPAELGPLAAVSAPETAGLSAAAVNNPVVA